MDQERNYELLDADKVMRTVEKLAQRIRERFGDESGLFQVCQRLCDIASKAQRRSAQLAQPFWSLRLAVGVLVLILIVGAGIAVKNVDFASGGIGFAELPSVLEAVMNDVVLIGAALFFLVTLEIRFKRRRALKAIHEIRSLAHVIDMHQLTKDPERLRPGIQLTMSSPLVTLTAFELGRYLDYCSEMLSLTGKIAVLYIQHFDDAVTIGSANEVEQLCTGLSRKIWQKIMILGSSFPDSRSR